MACGRFYNERKAPPAQDGVPRQLAVLLNSSLHPNRGTPKSLSQTGRGSFAFPYYCPCTYSHYCPCTYPQIPGPPASVFCRTAFNSVTSASIFGRYLSNRCTRRQTTYTSKASLAVMSRTSEPKTDPVRPTDVLKRSRSRSRGRMKRVTAYRPLLSSPSR